MHDLIVLIDERGRVTPRLTAIRWDGESVTYGQLRERVCDYDRVIAAAGLSELAALSAALLSLMPAQLRARQPSDQAELVAEAIAWLGREDRGRAASVTAVV
ncbi:hypothetical protein [Gordonia crocea]|uniref:Uncharacterized protein n=1 Tax=Gordonia crocea TaxID=589162 RepID=A0A7I9V1Y9_9ACTN|nr:hypothetical protein [Gordonia crocea]GED99415.1 hypothetical protein nbrc107697_34540 [Gordonia crocea]